MSASLPLRIDSSRYAVATRELRKHYGATIALDGLDLTVPENAVYALVGQNGSGKTTTFKILLDLVRPDAGTAEVFGFDAQRRGAEARAGIGYVPEQQDVGYGWMTVDRLLRHHRAYFPHWDDAYSARLVAELRVPVRSKFGTLSKGEARRTQLVLALSHRPPLLLLDEPTDGLDPLARDQVLRLLAEHLATAPATVLIATHYVHVVEGLADHLGVVHDGRFIAQSARSDLDRSLRRYHAAVPDGWQAPQEPGGSVLVRRGNGREIAWVVWGSEDEVSQALQGAGAELREVSRLTLEEAAVALLATEDTPLDR